MEILEFAKAYTSLGTAIQEQIDRHFDIGPVDEYGDQTITDGAMAYLRAYLIFNFRDSEIDEIVEICQELDRSYPLRVS